MSRHLGKARVFLAIFCNNCTSEMFPDPRTFTPRHRASGALFRSLNVSHSKMVPFSSRHSQGICHPAFFGLSLSSPPSRHFNSFAKHVHSFKGRIVRVNAMKEEVGEEDAFLAPPGVSFESLGVSAEVAHSLRSSGISHPAKIQVGTRHTQHHVSSVFSEDARMKGARRLRAGGDHPRDRQGPQRGHRERDR